MAFPLCRKRSAIVRAAVFLFVAFLSQVGVSSAQVRCVDTPEGRICRIEQRIVAGTNVSPEGQRALGLVTVNGGCSGALMNRFWILTARHCVTTDALATGMLNPPANLAITAAWANGVTVRPSEVVDFAANRPTPDWSRDIVMLYLGLGDFGDVAGNTPYITQRQVTTATRWNGARLTDTDIVLQYGQGLSTFATGSLLAMPPNAVQATGSGTYREGTFRPSSISETRYEFLMNGGQVGHGGDSGGPSVVFDAGRRFIAGVQSTCTATGYVPGYVRVFTGADWNWATGISACQYVSVEPYVREIGLNMRREPECTAGNACPIAPIVTAYVGDPESAIAPVLEYILRDDSRIAPFLAAIGNCSAPN